MPPHNSFFFWSVVKQPAPTKFLLTVMHQNFQMNTICLSSTIKFLFHSHLSSSRCLAKIIFLKVENLETQIIRRILMYQSLDASLKSFFLKVEDLETQIIRRILMYQSLDAWLKSFFLKVEDLETQIIRRKKKPNPRHTSKPTSIHLQ